MGVAELFDDLLEALLELTAVLRPGDERADVQREDTLALERLGHITLHDPVREAFGDGRLADAGLADERRIVLRAPGEDLDDPLDLLLAADDRVELLCLRHRREVHAELIERRGLRAARLAARGRRLALGRRVLLSEGRDDLMAHLLERDAERLEDAGGDALALPDQPEEEVLGADVAVPELPRFIDRELDDLLRARRQGDLTRRGRGVTPADDEFDGGADLRELDAERIEDPCGDALAFPHQPEEQMLGPDVVVVEADRLVLSERQDALGPVVEAVERPHQRSPVRSVYRLTIHERLYVRVERLQCAVACQLAEYASRPSGRASA